MKTTTFYTLILTLFALGLVLAMNGCDSAPLEAENYKPEPMLTAFIFNGEPVEEVWLERMASIYGFYRPEDNGIANAEVIIICLEDGDTLHFQPDPAEVTSGRYIPADGEQMIPQSMKHYRLEATTPQGEFLWSQSVMPDENNSVAITLVDENMNVTPVADGDTLNRNMPPMYWTWETVDSSGGYQGIITTMVDIDSLEGLDPEWEPEDLPEEPAERVRTGWITMRYDQEQILLPWLFFGWVGPTKIELYAISTEYYDYLYSLQMVESGLINHPQYNINGGLGVFGTISRHSIEIYMERAEL